MQLQVVRVSFLIALAFSLGTTVVGAQTVGGGYEFKEQWDGFSPGGLFGSRVGSAGDVNADGLEDFIVGDPGADPGGMIDAGSVYVFAGGNGAIIHQWDGTAPGERFGIGVSGKGDMNADGYDDLVISGWDYVSVYSGADGTLLQHWVEQPGERLGSGSLVGDLNSDGFDDVLANAWMASGAAGQEAGAVFAFSGLDGSQLYRWEGNESFIWFGECSAAGDVNGDGVTDVVIGSPYETESRKWAAGRAYVYSGSDGSLLYSLTGQTSEYSLFGNAVAGAGDVNQDGFDDVIVGEYEFDGGPWLQSCGAAYVFSGKDGTLIHHWVGSRFYQSLGFSVASAGDVNGDGASDLMVGAPYESDGVRDEPGAARVYSGADGAMLYRWFPPTEDQAFGIALASAFNFAGDGLPTLAVGGSRTNYLRLYQFNPFLRADGDRLSASSGGSISLSLDFPVEAGGIEYRVLVSASGIGPTWFGVDIPLTEDILTRRAWFASYAGAAIGGLHGTLDANGDAVAVIRMTAGNWTSLVGRSYHLAAVAMPAGKLPVVSSVAVPVQIVP